MSGRRVWVVSELYWPEETSTGHYLTGIAEGLAARFRVHVLCGQPGYRSAGLRAPARETRNGVRIERCAGTRFPRHRLGLRLLNILTFGLSAFLAALSRFRAGDAVLVVTNPPLLPFLVSLACRWKGCRGVLLVHDVYPDALVAAGLLKPRSLLARLLLGAQKRLLGSVRRVVALGRDMEALLRGRGADRVRIIPNWADLETVRPRPRAECRLLGELEWRSAFVVQYSGNLGRTHGIETLLACAEKLRSDDRFRFLVVGSGAKRGLVENCGLANVRLLTDRPRSDLEDLLSACDVALIPFVPGMAGISVPSRLYNVMASGRPVVAAADDASELARVVREEGIGWVVPPDDAEALRRVLVEAASDPARLRAMGERARAAAEGKYGYATVRDAYVALFDALP